MDFQVQEGQVQKKITPWSQMFDLEQESKKNPSHTDLIMVASLIDRAPNLGGLSRTCEIFGAGKLIVNNKKIINDKGGLISEGIFYREYDKREISILLLRVQLKFIEGHKILRNLPLNFDCMYCSQK